MYTIYLITNTVNGKSYVGQTKCGPRRWRQHKRAAATGDKHPLYKAMRKYGIENFAHQDLADFPTKEEADKAERTWILLLDATVHKNGYVCTEGGDGRTGPNPELRWARSNAARAQMKSGKECPLYRKDLPNDQIVKLYVEERKTTRQIAAVFGCQHGTIRKRLISEGVETRSASDYKGTTTGRKLSPETCAKMSRVRTGMPIRQKNKRFDVVNEEVTALYLGGMNFKEIATKLSCSVRIIRYRLQRESTPIRNDKKRK